MPRAGKKASALPAPNEDDSNVVFGDPKAAKYGSKGNTGGGPAKGGANEVQNSGADAPKKPDTRSLIGGASWTGKLPVNMLSEHCQRQKWAKPDYTMVTPSVSSIRAEY